MHLVSTALKERQQVNAWKGVGIAYFMIWN
jgi:hypothetical protein